MTWRNNLTESRCHPYIDGDYPVTALINTAENRETQTTTATRQRRPVLPRLGWLFGVASAAIVPSSACTTSTQPTFIARKGKLDSPETTIGPPRRRDGIKPEYGGGDLKTKGPDYEPAPCGLAPKRAIVSNPRWDDDSARLIDHFGDNSLVVDRPFTQVVNAGDWGLVFQRPNGDTILHDSVASLQPSCQRPH